MRDIVLLSYRFVRALPTVRGLPICPSSLSCLIVANFITSCSPKGAEKNDSLGLGSVKAGRAMGVFLVLEASQPHGTTYRIGFGWSFYPALASVVAALARLI